MAKGKKKGKETSEGPPAAAAADAPPPAAAPDPEPASVASITEPLAAVSLEQPGPSAKDDGPEAEGDGLGLAPAKRKRPPRKRKGAAAAEAKSDAVQPGDPSGPEPAAQPAPTQQPGLGEQPPDFAQQLPALGQQPPAFGQRPPGFVGRGRGVPPFGGRGMPPSGPPQSGPGQWAPGQGPPQAGPGQWAPGQGPPQAGPGQWAPGQGPPQAGPGQWAPGQGPPQAGPGQWAPGQGPPQAGPGQWAPGQGPPQAGPGQWAPGQGPPQAGPGQWAPGQGPPQAGHGQWAPGQGPPQAGPGQWAPGQGPPQAGPGQWAPGQGPPQAGPGQWAPGQGPPQAGPGQWAPGQGPPQAGPGQWAPGQGPPQAGPGQWAPGQGPPQPGPGQWAPGQGPPQAGPGHWAPGQGPPQPGPGHSAPGQMPGQGPRQAAPGPAAQRPPPAQPQSAPAQRTQAPPPAQGSQSAPAQRTQGPPHSASGAPTRHVIPKKIIDKSKSVPGRMVRLLTNYLAMQIQPIKVNRYDVSFTPDKPKKAIPQVFKMVMQKDFPKFLVAFDQMKNFYCVEALPKITGADKYTTKVELADANGKVMKFEVSIKMTGVVDFKTLIAYMAGGTSLRAPLEAIQCVDVVLRQGTLETYIKAGRQFFKRPRNPVLLGDGLEMWTGLFQSAIFTSRPFVNIDVAHKGFPIQQPVLALLESFRLDPGRRLEQQRGRGNENFMALIKGLRVVANIGGGAVRREYICNGVVAPPAELTFDATDAAGRTRSVTVADYFAREKGIRLKFPNLNCLHVGPRDKNIYYPMELCEVSYGQVRNKQLNDMQLAKMVREAATPPDQRMSKIKEIIQDMKYPNNPIFQRFGLKISDQFTPVQGKVMEPPKMMVGGTTVQPGKGMWQGNRLLQGAAMDVWGVIAVELTQNESNAGKLIELVMGEGQRMGLRAGRPTLTQFGVRLQDLQRVIGAARDQKLQLLVVIVNSKRRECYSQVKKIAERNVGVLTQCLKDQTVQFKLNPATVHNILLKVNSKLMGVNHALDQASVPACMRAADVMVVGADVTHAMAHEQNIPSIAAVTASLDPRCTQYNLEFSIQSPRKEMIVQFEELMTEHLRLYQRRNRRLPRKVYVFRDGVSEGQFAEMLDTEVAAVYSAYARLDPATKPEVMYLLVQKRHHTRFFNEKFPKYNAEPGTVVDTDIVHPTELDFYLVSHQAIKGTARPTRYHVIRNDGALTQDEVEQLTFYLCHLYSRCSRSVSYPTPTYYAHLACLRARALTVNETFDNSKLEVEPQRLRIKPEVHQCNPMFFV